MTDIDKLPEHLKTLSPDDWNELFGLLQEIERTKKFGEVKGGEKQNDGSIKTPYWEWSEVVDKFFDIVHRLGLVPVFDWTAWNEGKIILDNTEQDFNKFDTITLCKLLTTIIRTDRFNDGFLVRNFENGVIAKIIKALKLRILKS